MILLDFPPKTSPKYVPAYSESKADSYSNGVTGDNTEYKKLQIVSMAGFLWRQLTKKVQKRKIPMLLTWKINPNTFTMPRRPR